MSDSTSRSSPAKYPTGSTHTGVLRSATKGGGYRTQMGGGGTVKLAADNVHPVVMPSGAEARRWLAFRAGGRPRMVRTISLPRDRQTLTVEAGSLNLLGCTKAEHKDALVRYEAKFGPIQPKPKCRVSNSRLIGGRR